MSPLATDTIRNLPVEETYHIAETPLPDGTVLKQLFQYVLLPGGAKGWQLVDEKLRAFDESFKDTRYAPAPWVPPGTETLTPNASGPCCPGGPTRLDLRRQLILGFGDPQAIITSKGLDTFRLQFFKAHPSTLSLLHMMALKHGGEWAEAMAFVTPVFKDIL